MRKGKLQAGKAAFVVQRLPVGEGGKIKTGAYHATTPHLLRDTIYTGAECSGLEDGEGSRELHVCFGRIHDTCCASWSCCKHRPSCSCPELELAYIFAPSLSSNISAVLLHIWLCSKHRRYPSHLNEAHHRHPTGLTVSTYMWHTGTIVDLATVDLATDSSYVHFPATSMLTSIPADVAAPKCEVLLLLLPSTCNRHCCNIVPARLSLRPAFLVPSS